MKVEYQSKYREAIQQAVYNIRLLAPVKYKDFHDFKPANNEITIVDFPLIQWTDTISKEFRKQFAQYSAGFIETMKLYVESNYNDIKAFPADDYKVSMGVNFHNTEHIKCLLNVLAAMVEQPTTPMATTLPDELNTQKARKMLNKVAKEGFITIDGDSCKWNGTKALCAYFADKASGYLQLKVSTNSDGMRNTSWKPFEQLFGISRLAMCKNEWKNKTGEMPKGYREIDKLFQELGK